MIKVLPEALANKIAAGEVVERPSSVVKELVENAIDSGANKITIIIKNAGKSHIQIIDNGKGMSENDSMLAFERHATSKITNFEDFESLSTMGFRGEALPSIAGVAQVDLVTRTETDDLASNVKIDGSKIRHVGKASADVGTSITVKNLFFNVPARKTFLKTNATEFSHILNILKKFFLAYPEIHFECYHENDRIYHLPVGSLQQRIRDVLGENYFKSMVSVDEQIGEMRLHGFALRPELTRQSKGLQFIFINKRVVNSKFLNHAINKAYGEFLEKGHYAGYCLFLELDPKMIDVNVHPTKMEVKFTNDKMMYNFFTSSIQHAIYRIHINNDEGEQDLGFVPVTTEIPTRTSIKKNDISQILTITPKPSRKKKAAFIPNQASIELSFTHKDDVVDDRLLESKDTVSTENSIEQVFWQLHNQYILSQVKSGFVVIDQQLAHERILFEKVINALTSGKTLHSQQLLFPQTIELSNIDFEVYDSIETVLNTIGFTVKKFSGRTIVLESIPGDIKISNEATSLIDIIQFYKDMAGNTLKKSEKLAFSFASISSIKAGEPLSQTEMHALIDQLFATSSPEFSPVGKRIILKYGLDELNRLFR